MDPSTPSAQDAQNQKTSDKGIVRVQPPATSTQTPPQKTSVTISVNKEGPSAVILAENPNANEDDEDELVAPQEMKNQVIAQQGGASVQEEEIVDVEPSASEISASPEVERVIEKTSPEGPKITQELKEVGVTHSGPGIIPSSISVSENNFGIKNLPESYEQAAAEEKKTKLHDSKHWFSLMIMYIWRRLNPQLGKKKAAISDTGSSDASSAPTSTMAQPVQKPLPEPEEPESDVNVSEEEEDQKGSTSV